MAEANGEVLDFLIGIMAGLSYSVQISTNLQPGSWIDSLRVVNGVLD